jgi:hypothetical protein
MKNRCGFFSINSEMLFGSKNTTQNRWKNPSLYGQDNIENMNFKKTIIISK